MTSNFPPPPRGKPAVFSAFPDSAPACRLPYVRPSLEAVPMTTNQRQATDLARGIADGRVKPSELTDAHWSLLLLAAGMNRACWSPRTVSFLVLENANTETGYFSDRPMAGAEAQ